MIDINKKTVNIFNLLAKTYESKYMDVGQYDNALDFFCNQINNSRPNILELGCGPGNITKYILDRFPFFQFLCIDMAPNMLQIAQKNNPTISTIVMDARDLNSLPNTFDAIVIGFVFPYLSDVEVFDLIYNSVSKLNSNGVLYISTMVGKYSDSGWEDSSIPDTPKVYMHYHEKEILESKMKENGFEIIYNAVLPIHHKTNSQDWTVILKKIS